MSFAAIGKLFDYPGPDYHRLLRDTGSEMTAAGFDEFRAAISPLSTAELEELYTRTFDLNPDASLDIGWHLFGEDYARGEFLVNLRQQARRYGIPETTELPDHLTRVLPLVAAMPPDEAEEFQTRFLLPALDKIAKAIGDGGNPYALLIAGLKRMLPAQQRAPSRDPKEVVAVEA
jgi:nitrate reductase delta subunit